MKGAFLVSEETSLAILVLAAMQGTGAEVTSDGVAQFRDERNRLFTVFAYPDPEVSWEWRSGDVTFVEEGPPPEMDALSACWIECRWEDLFVAQVRVLALALSAKLWVIDGDGVLWPAASVDPERVRL